MTRRTTSVTLLALSVMILLSCAPAGAGEKVLASQPLIDLKEGIVPPFDPRNFRFSFALMGALTSVHGDPVDLSVSVRRSDGEWTGGYAASEMWLRRRLGVNVGALNFSERRLKGEIKIAVTRRRGKELHLAYNIDARIVDIGEFSKLPKRVAAAARARAAVRLALGAYQGKDDAAGAKGGVAGHLALVRRPGFFDRGRYDGGLALDLDMGTRRVNWNHHRSAHFGFPQPRDLSAFTGLRVKVRTDQPREDAAVTVWLGEEDGSWYHIKDAVPLVDRENEAVLRFSDFVLAEWVAPAGFHLDEDYVLDLKSISAFAIGVINPLGVGTVSFTVTAIDLIKEDLPRPGTVKLAVSGKTLSVNGHNVVPAGVFGGFARELPQEYRPGCQRGLYPSTRPRIPRQTFARFKDGQMAPDWPNVVDKLRAKGGDHPPLYKHLMSLVDDEDALARFGRIRAPKPGDKRAEFPHRDFVRLLNHLLEKPIYNAEAWKGVTLPKKLEAKLKHFAKGELNHTELMELNRRLLEAAFPELPRNPDYGPTEIFYIDCYGERKQKADFLARSDWREHLAAWGRAFAENARKSGCMAVLEFWNEPYLNWAEKSWVHYHPGSYKVGKAVDGGPVAVRRSSAFSRHHVRDWPRLVAIFNQGASEKEPTLAKRLYDSLDRRARPRFGKLPGGREPDSRLKQAMLRVLNDLLRRKDCYNEAWWKDVKLPREIQALLPILKEKRPDRAKLALLNRALLSAKYPGLFAPDPAAGQEEIIPHFKWKKIPTGWRVVDETAFTFWSGMGNGYIYDSMLSVIAKAVKETNPDVPVFGGWGFRWNEDHWDAWRIVYKNTIDRNIKWIDGVHEHHYMGDPIGMHGTYEVVAAYGTTRYKKWLYSINTETNDLLDTPARGRVDDPEKRKRSREYRQMVYNMRDCIYAVLQSPDKLFGRTVIHAYRMPEATRVGYGMMKNLRGRLIETASADPRVWVVASVDGTDRKAMPPERGQTLVVFVLNDCSEPRDIALDIQAPDGTRFKGGTIERNTMDWGTFAIDLKTQQVNASGRTAHFDFRLEGKLAWKISLPLDGQITRKDQVRRRQFFSKDILQKVRRARPFTTAVELDAKTLQRARRARLRLVVEGVARGEATVSVGGQTLALPAAYTQDNVTRIVELPLDVSALREQNTITFSVAPGNHAGYQVDMASIVLEERDE